MSRLFAGQNAISGTLQLPYPSTQAWRGKFSEPAQGVHSLVAESKARWVGELGLVVTDRLRRRHIEEIGIAVRDDRQGLGARSALMEAAPEAGHRVDPALLGYDGACSNLLDSSRKKGRTIAPVRLKKRTWAKIATGDLTEATDATMSRVQKTGWKGILPVPCSSRFRARPYAAVSGALPSKSDRLWRSFSPRPQQE